MINDKIKARIKKADDKLNKLHGWESNSVSGYVDVLTNTGSVEVGYRSQCGSTHITHKIYDEFNKVVKMLARNGIIVSVERVKHKNGYATINQGFWNSSIFRMQEVKEVSNV